MHLSEFNHILKMLQQPNIPDTVGVTVITWKLTLTFKDGNNKQTDDDDNRYVARLTDAALDGVEAEVADAIAWPQHDAVETAMAARVLITGFT